MPPQSLQSILGLAGIIAIVILAVSFYPEQPHQPTLWVWDGDQDLTFLEAGEADFAVLLGYLERNETGEFMIRNRSGRVTLPETQRAGVIRIPNKTSVKAGASRKAARAIATACKQYDQDICQVDFDATVSEREWYRRTLTHLQKRLPNQTVSMTANLSWCTKYDDWIKMLPVDHIVPMYFSLSVGENAFANEYLPALSSTGPCSQNAGFAVGQLDMAKKLPTRLFDDTIPVWIFSAKTWSQSRFEIMKINLPL